MESSTAPFRTDLPQDPADRALEPELKDRDSRRLASLRQEVLDDLEQSWQILLDQVPHDLVVDRVVPMRQDVPEGDNAGRIADSFGCC